MIARLIRWSVDNRLLVLFAAALLAAWGAWSARHTPIDVLPDLSDVQVIVRTPFPGQALQVVEDQVTYPLTTTLLSVPGARTVRGYSFFGDSFVYVLFADGTDLYWARSRVLEYLSQVQARLPATTRPALGPDATGVGWVYEYALIDRTGGHDLGELRALQDWFLRFELKTLPDVAEVASIGGMVRQFEVQPDPTRLAAYGITHQQEFLPPLDEGDLLYMPSALPGLSAQKAGELLQHTDRLIRGVPEVARVFGKAGRADSATDPAPLEMFETTVQLKPREQWRAGMTPEKLRDELDRTVRVPGLANVWIPPIRNRLDMLSTGIKSPIGVKVAGADLPTVDRVAQQVAQVAKTVPGVTSALAERLTGGRYVDVTPDRAAAARYGLNIADVQSVVASLVGGEAIGEVVDGRARYPISLRYPPAWRDTVQRLRELPFLTPAGGLVTLGTVARVDIVDGPTMLRTENARLSGWVYIDAHGRDLAAVVRDLRRAVEREVPPQPGISIAYAGQFEFLERANARLAVVVPVTLGVILLLLYLTFGRWGEALLIMGTLPFALTGGAWCLYLLGYSLSVATGVGFIALAGVAAEFGVIMLLYLNNARQASPARGGADEADLQAAIHEGAVLRVRPKAMTVAVIVAGLLPLFWGEGAGSEIMRRIAAPMVGGMLTAPLLSLLVIPAAYRLLRRRECRPALFN